MGGSILVTGATGFVGRALINQLVFCGQQSVRILMPENQALPSEWIGHVEVWKGDLVVPESLEGIGRGIRHIYHLAGEIRDPRLFDAVNRGGTKNLLASCRKEQVSRFLYFSSVGVFGADGYARTIDENTAPNPRNEYERSKYAGERTALALGHDSGIGVSVLRPSIIYGEGRNTAKDSFLSWLRLINNKKFFLLGSDYVSSYVYLGDVVAAAIAIISAPKTQREIFIANDPVTLRDFVDEIALICGHPPAPVLPQPVGRLGAGILRLGGRFGSLYNKTVYSGKKLVTFGITMPFGYRYGLRRTLEWYAPRLKKNR